MSMCLLVLEVLLLLHTAFRYDVLQQDIELSDLVYMFLLNISPPQYKALS
jgi:hypothetical protein